MYVDLCCPPFCKTPQKCVSLKLSSKIKTKFIQQSKIKPIEWKYCVDGILSHWNQNKQNINLFIEQANKFHPLIKLTVLISEIKFNFLYTTVFKGDRFQTCPIMDIKTCHTPAETFQYKHFSPSHLLGVK